MEAGDAEYQGEKLEMHNKRHVGRKKKELERRMGRKMHSGMGKRLSICVPLSKANPTEWHHTNNHIPSKISRDARPRL